MGGISMSTFIKRSVAQASEVRVADAALTVIAAPFYLLGWLLGLVVVVVVVAFGAIKLGIADARADRREDDVGGST